MRKLTGEFTGISEAGREGREQDERRESRREGSRMRLGKSRSRESNRQDIHTALDSIKRNVGKM